MSAPAYEPEIKLLRRAGFRCEYCRRSVEGVGWHRDHVVPRRAGGSSAIENLAVACPRCNVNKGAETRAVDPLTFREVALFNPRKQDWGHHFRRVNHFVSGTTGTGRATAALLFRQTARAQLSSPLPVDLGGALLHGSEDAYLRWLFGQRKASAFGALLAEVDPRSTVAEMEDLRSKLGSPEAPTPVDFLLTVERGAVLAETLTSRSWPEDLVLGERLCVAAIAVCAASRSVAAARLEYFWGKRILVWRQLAVCLMVAGFGEIATACLKVSIALALSRRHPAATEPVFAPAQSTVQMALPRRAWRTSTEMKLRWQKVRTEGDAGQIGFLLQFVDDIVFRGSRRDAEELGVLESMSTLTASSGYGMDADLHHGVLLMRRLILLQGRFEPAEISSTLDRHLEKWSAWGCLHSLRTLSLGLGFLHEEFGSRVGDALQATRSVGDAAPVGQGMAGEVVRLIESARAELESGSRPSFSRPGP